MGSMGEGKAAPKTERIRFSLKWLILASALTLVVGMAIAISMALKAAPASTSTSSSKDAVRAHAPLRPNHGLRPLLPSTSPSESPTGTAPPSLSPTITAQPTTAMPSLRPSSSPTTSQPTLNPTNHPTYRPTPGPPTYAPISPNHDFKMRLFWQKGYYWQESWREMRYCVECTKCDSYGSKDGWEYGCQRRNNGDCGEGDMFWVNRCNGGSKVNIVNNGDLGLQVRMADTNLCMRRFSDDRLLKAVKCDKNDKSQQWAPINTLSRFELRALEHDGLPEDEAMCVSQLHHPKNEEILAMHGCKDSRIYETRYWEEY
eukprot:scaffold3598_cov115-Cylindrotheca_fusiformis.AAC.1